VAAAGEIAGDFFGFFGAIKKGDFFGVRRLCTLIRFFGELLCSGGNFCAEGIGGVDQADTDSSHRGDFHDCILQFVKRRTLIDGCRPEPIAAQRAALIITHEMTELIQWNACPISAVRILARHDDCMNIFDLHLASSKYKNRRWMDRPERRRFGCSYAA
jgi:hypothetical protein